jgi:ABC-type glycerol-3-phosphate transport system permease component
MSTKNSPLRDRFWDFASYGFIFFLVASIVGPYSIVVFSSFKSRQEIFGSLNLIPAAPTLEPWMAAIDALGQPLLNSLMIATGTATLSLLITIPGAYVFGRKEFPGKEYAFYAIISALLFPHLILVVPIGSWWLDYGLYNTIPGLWIAYQAFVTPMAIWVLRDFFEGLPDNIEEAAQVYGCSQFKAFLRVVLPLSAPAIAAVGFLSFLSGWNDFLFANLLTNNTGPQTATVALFNTVNSGEQILWSRMMAAVIIVGVPPLILYLISRRYLGNAFSVS